MLSSILGENNAVWIPVPCLLLLNTHRWVPMETHTGFSGGVW